MKLLIIEDQLYSGEKLKSQLAKFGHVSDSVVFANEALHLLSVERYDMVILNLGISNMDGFQLLARIIQTAKQRLSILVTSDNNSLHYRLMALNSGADDYLTQPYEVLELEARLRAIWRRVANRSNSELTFGDLQYDSRQRQLICKTCCISLAKREAMLVEALMQSAPRIVIKDNLKEDLYSMEESTSDNAVEALVSRLRRKLKRLSSVSMIETHRGIGYCLVDTLRIKSK